MTLDDVAACVEALAPPGLAEAWDNVGWQVRTAACELRGVLVALDATAEVVAEAAAAGCNLLLTHHPLFFRPAGSLRAGTLVGDATMAAVRADVSIFAVHTNLDATPGGTSWALAEALGLEGQRPLTPGLVEGTGLGLVARAPEACTLTAWAERARTALGSAVALLSGAPDGRHATLALMGGSGGGAIRAAVAAGASLYVAADVSYHQAQEARASGLSLVVVDHYASEWPVMVRLARLLQERLRCAVVLSTTRTTPWEATSP